MSTKLDANQCIQGSYDESSKALTVKALSALVPASYDEVDLTYVPSGPGAGQIQTVVYKLATVTVATLTMGYDGSNNLVSVVKT